MTFWIGYAAGAGTVIIAVLAIGLIVLLGGKMPGPQ